MKALGKSHGAISQHEFLLILVALVIVFTQFLLMRYASADMVPTKPIGDQQAAQKIYRSAFVLGALPAVIALYFVYYALQRYQLGRKIDELPTATARSVAVGLAELSGRAYCTEQMRSPISDSPCAFWRVCVCNASSAMSIHLLYQKESSARFYLKDGTGKILVDPRGAEVDIPAKSSSVGCMNPSPPNVKEWQMGYRPELGLDALRFIVQNPDALEKLIRYGYADLEIEVVEYVIHEGDAVYVLGDAVSLPALSKALEPTLVMKFDPKNSLMYISNTKERKIASNIKRTAALMAYIAIVLLALEIFLLLI